METIGNRIAAARASKGWSQKQLAAALGCAPEQVSMWEAGRRTPRPKAVALLAATLGRTYDWLLLGVNPRQADVVMEPPGTYSADGDLTPAQRIVLRTIRADIAGLSDKELEAWFMKYQQVMDKSK